MYVIMLFRRVFRGLVKTSLNLSLLVCIYSLSCLVPDMKTMKKFIFLNWDSLHARLNSHYEAWSYKKKKHKKIRAHRKSV